jgi:DNA-binding IclR family transcriptional regulator
MSDSSKALSTKELCELTGTTTATMRRRLVRLERAGLVTRKGVRGGWRLNVLA